MKRYTKVLAGLFVACVFAAGAAWREIYVHQSGFLTVAFLDVGQGDSIYIESPTGTQVLVDAGATRTVLRRLTEVMPLFDTSLDMIIATHPDGDHVGGFVDVLETYTVGRVIYQHLDELQASPADAFEQALVKWRLRGKVPESSQKSSRENSLVEAVFKSDPRQESFSVSRAAFDGESPRLPNIIEPHAGDAWDIGGGAYIELLYPDRKGEASDTNASSVVARVVYGDTSFLLTGDAPQEVEEHLVDTYGVQIRSDVLKVGHHGSHTSTSPRFVQGVQPTYAVLSYGCRNTYGHPHKDTLETLAQFKINTLATCSEGSLVFISDGKVVERP